MKLVFSKDFEQILVSEKIKKQMDKAKLKNQLKRAFKVIIEIYQLLVIAVGLVLGGLVCINLVNYYLPFFQ